MNGIRVTMTTLRQHLGDFVNRAAYGNERIILVSRGEARAAIISMADLERFLELDTVAATDQPEKTLAAAAAVRKRVRAWQEAHGVSAGDVVADLKRLRGDFMSGPGS